LELKTWTWTHHLTRIAVEMAATAVAEVDTAMVVAEVVANEDGVSRA
jgi:hypothetical protein